MEEEFLIGDWIREKVLGSGSFGVVSLWRNIKTNEDLAVKMCKWGDDVQLTPKHKERWSKEVEMMNIIKSDNIVGTRQLPKELELGFMHSNISRLPILCMEYCSKGDLRQILNQPEFSNGLSEIQVRCILKDMKSAISYLHNLKITHRDLKPENIVLQVADGDVFNTHNSHNIIYKLIDLGYAKEIDSNSVCASFVGTLQYLAPELLYSKTYSNTVDYWSFGLVAFEIITGIRPFLPNIPPVQWMQYVKKKTSDHICVYQNLRGEVEYSSSLFEENFISNCFKDLMEKWLRLALDWDPKRRGHNLEEKCVKFSFEEDNPQDGMSCDLPKESTLAIFTMLDTILSKKILKLFSVATYDHLSYEIDDSTLFTTVQGWIERDTKVVVNSQMFITSKQEPVNVQSFAHLYWDEKVPVMLYFYQTDSLVNDNVKPKVPPNLRYCLENPKLKLSYTLLLGIYTNTLYFVNSEKVIYETLIKAYILRIDNLKQELKNLYNSHNEAEKSMCKLIEKNNLLSSLLELNSKRLCDQTKDNHYFTAEYKTLLFKCKNICDKVMKLNEAWIQVTNRLQSATRRCNEINETDISSKLKTDAFNELEKLALNHIIQVRRIPREERGSPKPCIGAVKIVYKCLKLRDVLLHNVQTQQIVQKILDIHIETEKMNNIILSVSYNAEDLSKSLTTILLEKELIMFKLLDNTCLQNADSNMLPCTLPGMNGNVFNSIDFKIGEAVRSPKPFDPPKESKETMDLESLINDNLCLRMASQNFIQKYYEKHKSIQEDVYMDFSYLDE